MYLKSTVLCSFADTIFFGTRDQLEFPEDHFRNHSLAPQDIFDITLM